MAKIRNRHFLISDIVLLPIAVYVSYLLRLESIDPSSAWWPGMLALAICIILTTITVFYLTGVYSRFWLYASVDEVMLLTGAYTISTLVAALAALAIGYVVQSELWIPRSIPFILLLIGLVVTAGPRLFVRVWTRRTKRTRYHTDALEPVLIMGAGDTGAALVLEIQNNPQLGLDVIGFLDDDDRKHNVVIHGVTVLGGRSIIPTFAKQYDVKQVIIAMPSASGKEISDVVRICEEAHVHAQTVPGTTELLDGRISINEVRDVLIDDLLRREPITTDLAAVRDLLNGKRVLITGGGGSIGGELARQVFNCRPQHLVLLGHGENSIFGIFHELSRWQETNGGTDNVTLRPVIADIRSEAQMDNLLAEVRPDVIFHAAAHKHVPLMELNPAEAVLNNVGGTRSLLRAAEKHRVERFVMISTDKAVNPTSVMGATKRVAEQIVQDAAARSDLTYVIVRFGNVLGSRGSVVPIFQKQIAAGGPVTVTHPAVERFFMTIPEAVQLVLQASVLGAGGELFMLDMGEPVKIVDLASDLIRLSGLEVDRDIDIVFTGLRPGDKLFEEMFMPSEEYARTEHTQIYIAENGVYGGTPDREKCVDELLAAAVQNNCGTIYSSLHALVPEYKEMERDVRERSKPDSVADEECEDNQKGFKLGKALHSVLLVCTANRIRSVMAEALLRERVNDCGEIEAWEIGSAGTWASDGLAPMPYAIRAMAERGIDVSKHRSRAVEHTPMSAYKLILVMERGHKESLTWEFPIIADRVYLLSEMVNGNYDVVDPVTGTLQDHLHTADVIDEILSAGFERIIEFSCDKGAAKLT